MKKKVCSWLFALFCILCITVYGVNLGTVILFLLGIAALPIQPVGELWSKISIRKKWFRPTIMAVMFFAAVSMFPQQELDSKRMKSSEIAALSSMEQSDTVQKALESSSDEPDYKIATVTESAETEATEVQTTEAVAEAIQTQQSTEVSISVADIPAYSGSPYVVVHENIPQFLESDLTTASYEYYSDLDELGRCGAAYACIGQDLMPTEERGNIGAVKPTGWHTIKYDVVDGKYLYNRCHLIGYQLSGENANKQNLITGTRYMNVEGMLPFENLVADYVQETGNHVMYRVTPIFEGENLLASGVQIEAQSVEDGGEGVLFNVYCYNVQPDITIDYASGESSLKGENTVAETTGTNRDKEASNVQKVEVKTEFGQQPGSDVGSSIMVWKSATGETYHNKNNCGSMNPANATQLTKEAAEAQGLEPCKKCF